MQACERGPIEPSQRPCTRDPCNSPPYSCSHQAQAEAGERAAKDIASAKGAIHELHEKIKDIKSKAEQSELMVQDICRDIKQLDYAKRYGRASNVKE